MIEREFIEDNLKESLQTATHLHIEGKMLSHLLFLSILFLFVSGRNPCSKSEPSMVTQYLIGRLEKEATTTCDCNSNVTDCLCLPVSSYHNCSTSCFEYGLTMMSHTLKPDYNQTIKRVKNYVQQLGKFKCKPFSCYQPCNETFTVNTMQFLKFLQENFQKAPISNNQ
ncbi:interleukin-9 [Monodelphis domestica]|uniref:Interleukin 9 n=1 Tax=Monodelphis domestica TaxID=13616 RepID=K7E6B0_MONDO|nr:interleukin-9 [Monodelphis domestica]